MWCQVELELLRSDCLDRLGYFYVSQFWSVYRVHLGVADLIAAGYKESSSKIETRASDALDECTRIET